MEKTRLTEGNTRANGTTKGHSKPNAGSGSGAQSQTSRPVQSPSGPHKGNVGGSKTS